MSTGSGVVVGVGVGVDVGVGVAVGVGVGDGIAVGVVVESMGTARTGETTSATDALTGVAKAASGVGLASTADGVGIAVGVGVGNWVGACTTGSGSAQAVSNARAIMTTIPIRDLLEIIIRVFVWHNLFARRRREIGSQVVEVTGVRRRQNRTISVLATNLRAVRSGVPVTLVVRHANVRGGGPSPNVLMRSKSLPKTYR